jgi:hypothetical protein
MDKNNSIGRKAKYNKKAYKNLNLKLKPHLYKEMEDLKETLAVSNPQLLKILLDTYKKNTEIVKTKKTKGDNIMKNKELIEKMGTMDGVWVLGRNILLEKALGGFIKDSQKYNPYKLITNGEYFIVYSIVDKLPNIRAYNREDVSIIEEDSKITVEISGETEFSDFYYEGETEEEYIQNFLQDWDLTEEEIKKYSKTYEQQELEEVNISITEKKVKDERETSEETKKHPLIKQMEDEKGVWFKENNLAARAIFEDKIDEKFPKRKVNLRKDGEEIIVKTVGTDTIIRKYHEDDLVFEVKNDEIMMIRKEKHFEEIIEKTEESLKDLEKLQTINIL